MNLEPADFRNIGALVAGLFGLGAGAAAGRPLGRMLIDDYLERRRRREDREAKEREARLATEAREAQALEEVAAYQARIAGSLERFVEHNARTDSRLERIERAMAIPLPGADVPPSVPPPPPVRGPTASFPAVPAPASVRGAAASGP